MAVRTLVAALLLASCAIASAHGVFPTRKILQSTDPNGGPTVTVSADSTRVDAVAITPALPYPQTGIFCNVTGDSRIPSAGAFFPLTVRVPVGVQALVVFANVTGSLPNSSTSGSGSCSSVVQQPGTSVVQQPGTSVVQQPGGSGGSVVQQPGTPGVAQPGTAGCTTSVLQQPTSVVQQQQQNQPPSSVVQQPPSSVVQQPPSSVVQQPPSSVVQQPPSSVVQQPPSSVVQQPPSSVVQQPPSSVVQQPPSSVVQQPPSSGVVQQGRKLLQTPAPVEFISNNGSMGQPQLSVTDTVEGVPNISFKPTAPGQTASFTGALQVAVTTTNDGLGTPFIPYQVDAKLSPNCGVTVKFVSF